MQAQEKGIDAIMINEDTTHMADIWKRARTTAAMAYLSPEMAFSPSFQNLWKDTKFRSRITAIIIDEAHCVDEWGGEDFRPQYRQLSNLRNYTGQEVPFFACPATCRTSTFDTIWSTLGYGFRPFWGLDVGTDRRNLFFITRPLMHPKDPVLEILNLLPQLLSASRRLEDIDKALFYFDSEATCWLVIKALRKILPPHLRQCIQAFSSDLSTKGKEICWDQFRRGILRIICATDAAGMGCNVPNVKYVVTFGVPNSVGTVGQRWGRAGCDRITEGVCILLVPQWAFRPKASRYPTPFPWKRCPCTRKQAGHS